MTQLTRIIDLVGDPVVGQRYLVPTVAYQWRIKGPFANWPVFPTRHEDSEHLNFPWPHYHVDPRFVSPTDWKELEGFHADVLAAFQHFPLQQLTAEARGNYDRRRGVMVAEKDTVPHPPIIWRARQCHRSRIEYRHAEKPIIEDLARSYAGQKCRSNKAGWVCPHKNYPLGSHAPDERGIITCPLHGLRVEASSGVVLAPVVRPVVTFEAPTMATRYDALPRDPATGRPVIS